MKSSAEWMTFALTLLLTGCLTGCESQQKYDQFMDGLRQSRFRGNVEFREAGSPIAFHMVNSFELGPKTLLMSFNGEVDFTQAPISTGEPIGP